MVSWASLVSRLRSSASSSWRPTRSRPRRACPQLERRARALCRCHVSSLERALLCPSLAACLCSVSPQPHSSILSSLVSSLHSLALSPPLAASLASPRRLASRLLFFLASRLVRTLDSQCSNEPQLVLLQTHSYSPRPVSPGEPSFLASPAPTCPSRVHPFLHDDMGLRNPTHTHLAPLDRAPRTRSPSACARRPDPVGSLGGARGRRTARRGVAMYST